MNMIASSRGTRLLESFSERREAVKLYLAHKLARFFLLSSLEYLRVHSNTGTGYTRLPEIDSQAGAALHACHSHSFIKLPVSGI